MEGEGFAKSAFRCREASSAKSAASQCSIYAPQGDRARQAPLSQLRALTRLEGQGTPLRTVPVSQVRLEFELPMHALEVNAGAKPGWLRIGSNGSPKHVQILDRIPLCAFGNGVDDLKPFGQGRAHIGFGMKGHAHVSAWEFSEPDNRAP